MTHKTTEPSRSPTSRSSRILIVEDEALIAMDIADALGRAGYDVVGIAPRCQTALALAEKECPDLVLMDIQLAGSRDGVETAALIRQRFGIRSLFISSRPARELAIHSAKTDAVGWLPKPASAERLQRAVADALA